MDIKATIFFKFGAYGWTESYVDVGAVNFQGTEAKTLQLITVRRRALASNVQLDHVRLSDILVERDSRQVEIPTNKGKGAINDFTEHPHTRVICRCDSGDKYRKVVYVGGVPDGSIQSDAGFMDVIDPARSKIEDFLAYLNNQWGFVVRDKEPKQTAAPNAPLYGEIRTVLKDAGTGEVTIVTKQPHLMTANSYVNITGVKGMRINGIHPMKLGTPAVADEFILTDFGSLVNKEAEGIFVGGGKWRAHAPKAVMIDKGRVERVGGRKTGSPFDRPHGRARTRTR